MDTENLKDNSSQFAAYFGHQIKTKKHYLSSHNGRETEVVKHLSAVHPYVHRAVLPFTLIIKAIHLKNGDKNNILVLRMECS